MAPRGTGGRGWWRSRSTAASSPVASPAVAATSNPALSSSLVRPASSSTESSAITPRGRPGPAVPGSLVTGPTLWHRAERAAGDGAVSLGTQRGGRAGAGGPACRQQRPGGRDGERGQGQQREPGRREHLGEAGRDAGVRGY